MITVTVTTSSLEYAAHHPATCSTSLPHPFPEGWRWVARKASPDLPSSLFPCLVQLPCFIQAWFYFQIPIIQLWVICETDEPSLFPQRPTLPFRLLCKLCLPPCLSCDIHYFFLENSSDHPDQMYPDPQPQHGHIILSCLILAFDLLWACITNVNIDVLGNK